MIGKIVAFIKVTFNGLRLCFQNRPQENFKRDSEGEHKRPPVAPLLKKAAGGFRVVHAFRPVLGNDAGGVQLGGSGDTADDRPTARARMGDRGLCERP
jgi:hypothetical protein